jgi:hypothetical protein
MRARAVITAVAAAALILPATSLAHPATTAPGKKITIVVVLNDQGVRLAAFTQQGAGSVATLAPLTGPVPRGDFVSINVYNRGSKAHNFRILGKTTRTMKPGGKAHLFVTVLKRGKVPYSSPLDKGKAFTGFLTVGDPAAAGTAANAA